MREIETDYLVVGAGATGMSFTDTLIELTDADVVMVDRRHRPGGHWLDAYPFVRLHQPSAYYGVSSRPLGHDRIDETGPNAGFYERATAAEICDYFGRVLDEHLLPSGRVRFLGMSDYRGGGEGTHQIASLVAGEEVTVKVRRRIVDATYLESSIPARHTPSYEIDPSARFVTPNALVDLDAPATGFTVIGAGKTSMDTCVWLLDQGVPPEDIRWVRPRDPWTMNRGRMQPLELVAGYMELQASWVHAAAHATSGQDFALRMEADGVFMRIDPDVEPEVWRGPIVSELELEALRRITNVVRLGRIRSIGADEIALDAGVISTDRGQVHVDCTAEGVRRTTIRPVFEGERITPQFVTLGVAPWSAATIAAVEAMRSDDATKNELCPVASPTGDVADIPKQIQGGMNGLAVRGGQPDLAAWNESTRLNPTRGVAHRADDPQIAAAFTKMAANFGAAMANLARLTNA